MCQLIFVIVIKHHDQSNIHKEVFIWAYQSRELEAMMVEAMVDTWQQEHEAMAHTTNIKLKEHTQNGTGS